jgi:hypothetical protein
VQALSEGIINKYYYDSRLFLQNTAIFSSVR